tara:strand:+ start:566 stop:1285 length:720 start_codon:yes stop_codon:yes gene_type:complete
MAGKWNLGSFVEATAYAVLDEIFAEFRSGDGFARPSRYEIMLQPPMAKKTGNIFQQLMGETSGSGDIRKTSLRCQSIEFPGRNLDTNPDINIYGPTREVVQGFSFADITGVFQCSSDLKEKVFFETWQRLAYNPQTWNMQYYDDYVGSMKIFQLDENDRQRYGIELVECFPKTIAAQTLDYGTANAIQTVSITFSYRYWKNLGDEADIPKSLGNRIIDAVLDTVESKITSSIPAVLRKL